MGVVRDRTKSYLSTATSSQLCQAASALWTGNSSLPGSSLWCLSQATQTLWKKAFFFFVLRGLYLSSSRGTLTLFSHEWCPLELCEGSALAPWSLYFS